MDSPKLIPEQEEESKQENTSPSVMANQISVDGLNGYKPFFDSLDNFGS